MKLSSSVSAAIKMVRLTEAPNSKIFCLYLHGSGRCRRRFLVSCWCPCRRWGRPHRSSPASRPRTRAGTAQTNRKSQGMIEKILYKKTRIADPHHLSAHPDPAFHINVDPDPAYQFNMVPDSDLAPHLSDANLRPLFYRPAKAQFWASTPPLWASTALHSSILSLYSSWI